MKRFAVFVVCLMQLLFVAAQVKAQSASDSATNNSTPEVFYQARVEKILDHGVNMQYGVSAPYQKVVLKIVDGDRAGKEITVDHGSDVALDENQLAQVGEKVLVVKTIDAQNAETYQIIDHYRIDALIPVIAIFFLIIIILSGWMGVGSIVGMIVSLGVIAKFIVPLILSGKDPLLVSIIGCLTIMVSTIYLAHGFSQKTTLALVATFLTMVATGLLSVFFVKVTHLTGLGSEDAALLKLGATAHINFKGLLLGGILIGSLGVLDDVTTGLTASIFELAKVNQKLRFIDLFKSGLIIGREHIASLVNTLVLAYAGSALPLFIIFVLNPNHYPLNVMLNDGLIIEEVVRTLAGSIGLVLAVPLTAFLTSYYIAAFSKKSKQNNAISANT